jgi:hypothetical protein
VAHATPAALCAANLRAMKRSAIAKAHIGSPLLIPREARDQAPAADRLSMGPRRAYGAPIILDSFGSFAMFVAIRRASSRVSSLAAERRPDSSSK